jgi:hypothetical protein
VKQEDGPSQQLIIDKLPTEINTCMNTEEKEAHDRNEQIKLAFLH